jgi:glycosyltransferase involved in cell wall biosynthesis
VKVSIIVPVLYGEPDLRRTVRRLRALGNHLDLEILLVVDVPDPLREEAVRQATEPIAEDVGARVHYRIGKRGFGTALREGFSLSNGDIAIPFMGDACDDPDDIPRLVAGIEQGFDVIAGSRYMRDGRIIGNTLKQRLSHLYSFLMRLCGGPRIHDISNAFKAYRREVLESVDSVSDSFDVSVELTLKASRAGFRVGEIATDWTNRRAGRSHFSFRSELRNYGRWLLLALRTRQGRSQRPGVGVVEKGT